MMFALPPCRCGTGAARGPFGFTLIELMMVMGIMALILATGIPPFVTAMRKEGLRKAVSDMVEGCSHARAQAVLHGMPTELVIRADDGMIAVRPLPATRTIDDSDGGLLAPDPATVQPVSTTFKAHLPDDIGVTLLYVNFKDQMDALESRVRFYPNGTCDEFTIILSAASGERKISLDVITGLADVTVIR